MRVDSVDALRGLVMVLMALDHVRDFVGDTRISPTDLTRASTALFAARWVTHLCAPVFFLLTGTGAYLRGRHRSARESSAYLATRGLWLIVLEVVVLRCLGWQFNVDYHVTMLTVLWALGWAMIVLAVLVQLPVPVVGAIGAVMIAGHNLLDPVRWSHPLWSILHSPNVIALDATHVIFVAYVLVPWVGVTAVGYALGRLYERAPADRRVWLVGGGAALAFAFVALRAIDAYGDPVRWSAQRSALRTVLSFVNTTKYPPSLLFLLMTLGPALVLLAAFDRRVPRLLAPALVFGRVPLFYYAVHAPLIHLVAIAICYARYGDVHWMFESATPAAFPITPPPGWGVPLPAVYAIWLGVVLALYPLCRWYAGVKRAGGPWWLRYI